MSKASSVFPSNIYIEYASEGKRNFLFGPGCLPKETDKKRRSQTKNPTIQLLATTLAGWLVLQHFIFYKAGMVAHPVTQVIAS